MGKSHWAADGQLQASDIKWSAVGPTTFLENFHSVASFYKAGTVYGASASTDALPHVSNVDIGRVAAALIDAPEKFENRVFRITGGNKYSDADIVAALNRQLGKARKQSIQCYYKV